MCRVKGVQRRNPLQTAVIARPSGISNRRSEFLKELIGNFFGRAIDETLAKLSQLAADLRLHVVSEQCPAVLLGEGNRGTSLGKAGHAPITFTGYLVPVGWVEVRKMNLAFEARFHRPDLGRRDRLKFRVGRLVELLATGDTNLEHLGIVELCPDDFSARRKLNLPGHRHSHPASPLQSNQYSQRT